MGCRSNVSRRIVRWATGMTFIIMGAGVLVAGLVVALVNMIGKYEDSTPFNQSDWTAEDWKEFWGDEW